jgi:hypothetical protein
MKMDYIKDALFQNDLNIVFLQETEIVENLDKKLLVLT